MGHRVYISKFELRNANFSCEPCILKFEIRNSKSEIRNTVALCSILCPPRCLLAVDNFLLLLTRCYVIHYTLLIIY